LNEQPALYDIERNKRKGIEKGYVCRRKGYEQKKDMYLVDTNCC